MTHLSEMMLRNNPSRSQGGKPSSLIAYFVLAYAITWATLGLVALASQGLLPFPLPSGLRSLLMLIGSSGPLLAALLIVATTADKGGMRAFFRPWLTWRVGLRWYLVVLFEPALAILLAMAGAFLLNGTTFNLAHPAVVRQLDLPLGINPWLLIIPVFIVGGLIGGPLGEEPGWRGFALARLQNRFGPLTASLLLGLLWSMWHLPFFFIKGTSQSSTPFLLFVLGTVANSVLIAWVYNHTRGSVLLALLFHAALNMTALYLPISLWNDWRGVTIQCLVALSIVIISGPTRFARQASAEQTPPGSELSKESARTGRLSPHNS
ncbi:CPBP family intramembrane glutamic endopeptidase [Ktedonosporobacter rubrisoli]|nr:type II CAAX endopeptidase family protein [Ktedonosporobacter rubrisoli]